MGDADKMGDEDKPFTKYDGGKARPDLLPPLAVLEVSKVLEFGAKKYAAHNWSKSPSWSRYSAAGLRHVFAWLGGEDLDPESDLHHLAHAICCLLFVLECALRGLSTDDRFKPPTEPTHG